MWVHPRQVDTSGVYQAIAGREAPPVADHRADAVEYPSTRDVTYDAAKVHLTQL
jgi:hypothetical protein